MIIVESASTEKQPIRSNTCMDDHLSVACEFNTRKYFQTQQVKDCCHTVDLQVLCVKLHFFLQLSKTEDHVSFRKYMTTVP